MALRTPAAIALVVAVVGLLGIWQVADDGLAYAKSQLRSQPSLQTEVGVPTQIFAFRARFMDDAREYGVVIVGVTGWTSRKVRVEYKGAIPTSAKLI